MSRLGRAAVTTILLVLLSACGQPLTGTYVAVEDEARFYTFSKWSKSWTSYYDETGSYTVDGKVLVLDTGGGIDGTIVSESEFQLNDVSGWHPEREHQYRVYRRKAEPE